MKNIILIFITYIIIFCLLEWHDYNHNKQQQKRVDTVYVQEVKSDWELLQIALIWQESKGNPKARNGDAVGILQITPIYVAEANRILKSNTYSLADRKSASESLKMFNIVQSFYNPEKCVKKAIKLHNPNAGDWYYNSIINYFNILKYNQN